MEYEINLTNLMKTGNNGQTEVLRYVEPLFVKNNIAY